jgi:hypothetical protein
MRGLPTHRGAVCLGKRTLRIHLLTDHLGNFTDCTQLHEETRRKAFATGH